MKTSEIKWRIRTIATKNSVSPDLAVKIAECESSLNPLARRINNDGSIDRGLFQWNNLWHPEISDVCAYNIDCSTKAFCKAIRDYHIYWWNASKKCWKETYRVSLLKQIRTVLQTLIDKVKELIWQKNTHQSSMWVLLWTRQLTRFL